LDSQWPSFAVKGDSGSTLNKKALAEFTHTVFELGARQLKKASKSPRSHLYRGERQPVFSLPQENVQALQTWGAFSVMHAFLYNRKYSYKFICRKVQTDCIVYTYICQILPNCLLKFLDVKRALFFMTAFSFRWW
jgi:hypothetical protein